MGIFQKLFGGRANTSAEHPVERTRNGSDDYIQYLRIERKEKTRPALSREDATEKFYSYQGKKFDFSDIPVAKYQEISRFLLDGANADKVVDDLYALNKFAAEAEEIADVPDFRAPLNEILLLPEWREKGYDMRWEVSHIAPLPLTKTGGYPKYPFRIYIETRGGDYSARVKYTQSDTIGEAEIRVNSPDCYHIMTVRDGKIIRIIRTVGMENFPVYSSK